MGEGLRAVFGRPPTRVVAAATMGGMNETSSSVPVDVAVVGVGRMGRHHARIYHQLPQTRLVAVVDGDAERAGEMADAYGCEALSSVEALLARHGSLGAVSVAVPTRHHLAVARPLLERRIACLVEKPLAPSPNEARQLVDLAKTHGATLQVGHTERFNPAVRAVAAMGITPRFLEVNRVSPMTFRSLDVGVVMDMMIHDLDIVLMLANAPIRQVDAAGVAVMGEKEDVANARLVFETGCVANLTASRLALKTERKLRLFSESAYVSLDYQQRSGLVIRSSDNAAALTGSSPTSGSGQRPVGPGLFFAGERVGVEHGPARRRGRPADRGADQLHQCRAHG